VSRVEAALVVPSAVRRGGGDIWLAQLLTTVTPKVIDLLVVFEAMGELVDLAHEAGHRTAVLGRAAEACDADLVALAAPLAEILDGERSRITVHWSPRAHVYGTRARALAHLEGPVAWVQHVIPSRFWLHRLANALPADAVICVSSAVADANRDLYPQRRCRVLHPGIDPEPATLDQVAARWVLGVPTDALVVGVLGRLEPWKGQDVAVRALRLLRTRGLAVHGLMAGERSPTWPWFADELQELIDRLGMRTDVTLTGHLASPGVALAAMDVLVCASHEEGFGLAVVEAMAAGVPVVATRCGGPHDLITDGRDGVLVPTDDPVALAASVAWLAEDPAARLRLVDAAARTHARRFTARRGADRFLALIQELSDGL